VFALDEQPIKITGIPHGFQPPDMSLASPAAK
jgi:hypothetical protein